MWRRQAALPPSSSPAGWSVWWDPAIRSGESFIVLINREISAASCVVVLWSKASVASHWVMEEAHNALTRDIICPVMVERDSQLPVGFATVKYIPLWEWRDGEPVGGFGPLIDELEMMVGKPAPSAPARPEAVVLKEPAPAGPPDAAPPEPARPPPPAPLPARELAERRRYVDLSDMNWMDIPVMALLLLGMGLLAVSIFDAGSAYLIPILLAAVVGLLAPPTGAIFATLAAGTTERPVRVILGVGYFALAFVLALWLASGARVT